MRTYRHAFTLVEILIVVIILGILAAIVIPQFTNATADAKISSVKTTLSTLRQQVEYFKLQHNDIPPKDATAFSVVLLGKTTVGDTVTTAAAGTFGPYITNVMPTNPLNNTNGVGDAAATTVGWVYVMTPNTTVTPNQYPYAISAVDTAGAALLTY